MSFTPLPTGTPVPQITGLHAIGNQPPESRQPVRGNQYDHQEDHADERVEPLRADQVDREILDEDEEGRATKGPIGCLKPPMTAMTRMSITGPISIVPGETRPFIQT